MSNPDSSTPSIQALDRAVKPARYRNWQDFITHYEIDEGPYQIALAHAELLDKADKVGRMVAEWAPGCPMNWHAVCVEVRKSLILPEPIDPDLLEAREMVDAWERGCVDMTDTVLAAIKRGRELAKEQDRG